MRCNVLNDKLVPEILMLIFSYWIKKIFINLRTVILIKRWQVTSSGKSLVLYGDTPEEIREKWDCVDKDCEIVPYENDEYIDMIYKIKEKMEGDR